MCCAQHQVEAEKRRNDFPLKNAGSCFLLLNIWLDIGSHRDACLTFKSVNYQPVNQTVISLESFMKMYVMHISYRNH